MARPGWAGTRTEPPWRPWWQRAVFYGIDPARFQASGDGSTGDLAGIALRLDYLQSLGVDALVLEAAAPTGIALAGPAPASPFVLDSLETLIREASRHRLRVLPALPPALAFGDRTPLLQTVHEWLSEGAAGIALPEPPPASSTGERNAYNSLVTLLAGVLRATAGDRVLLAESAFPPSLPTSSLPPSFLQNSWSTLTPGAENRLRARGGRTRGGHTGEGSGQLTAVAVVPADPATAASLRSALLALAAVSPRPAAYPDGLATYPLLRLVPLSPGDRRDSAAPDGTPPNTLAAAAALLTSPAAALLDFGAEIGLDSANRNPKEAGPLMQWTPSNVQQPAPEGLAAPLLAPGQPTPFGAYKPFVRPPPRSLTGSPPAGPAVELDRDLPPPPPAPDSLLGFTTGGLPVNLPVNLPKNLPSGAESASAREAAIVNLARNVAVEERDPHSILHAFRALLALRQANPTLREGGLVILNRDAESTLLFLRRPPSGAQTAGTVVVAANLGDAPVQLSLDADLAPLGLSHALLRALFTSGPQTPAHESTGALRLPPHAVFIGELRPAIGRSAKRGTVPLSMR